MAKSKAKKNTDITKRGKVVTIDEDQLETLASRFWTKTEIASFYGCSDQTIDNKYNHLWLKGREAGKAKLRDLQLKSAVSGNVVMLIWLGKQYLGQSDKMESNSDLNPDEINRLKAIAKKEFEQSL